MGGWIFNRLHKKGKATPRPLRIEGIGEAPFTAEPDAAERAAQQLLELISASGNQRSDIAQGGTVKGGKDVPHDAAYFRQLAERIRYAQRGAEIRVTRFVTACEYTLENKDLPYYGDGSLALLEAELYKRFDVVERAGGELKRRWQHCLAEVIVRLMDAPAPPEKEK